MTETRSEKKNTPKSRVQKSERNLKYGSVYQIVYLFSMFAIRVTILKFLGIEMLSINNLFSQVVTLLSLTEAGLSQCVTYRLYKPLADSNEEKLSEILTFYKKSYRVIAVAMFLIGLCLIPVLPSLITKIEVDMKYVTFVYILFLFQTSAGYFFTSRFSILWADNKTYLLSKYNLIFRSVFFALDMLCICVIQNYTAFLICEITYTLSYYAFMSHKVERMYPYILEERELPKNEQKSLLLDVRRMFIGKVSGKVLNSTDNILISKLVGTNLVGVYGQYSMFLNGFLSVFAQINEAVVGSVGNTIAVESKLKAKSTYDKLHYFFFVFGAFCSCCLFAGVNPFLKSIIGKQYLLDMDVIATICVVLFFEILKMPLYTFFNAAGMFKEEQYISLLSCIFNLVSSVILGLKYGMIGIFYGTILSLIIAVWLKVMEMGKKKFDTPYLKMEVEVFGYLLLFLVQLGITWFLTKNISFELGIVEFLVKCVIAGIVSMSISILPFIRTDACRYWMTYLTGKFGNIIRKGK